MFLYIVVTPISTTSGLWSTGNTRKYQQIDVYIYQCVNPFKTNEILHFWYSEVRIYWGITGYNFQIKQWKGFILTLFITAKFFAASIIFAQIYRGYSNFLNEYAIYFIEWSEKCIFHEWRSHEWNIHFLASWDEINGIFIPKFWISFYYIQL